MERLLRRPASFGMRPLVIEKGRLRLLFNEPHNQGALSLQIDGSGGLCIFLDADDLTALSKATWYAAKRIAR